MSTYTRHTLHALSAVWFLVFATACSMKSSDENQADQGISIHGATVAFYEVRGQTAQEIRDQMDALGPCDDSGESYHSRSHSTFRWSWPGYGTTAGDVSKAIVTMRSFVTMPIWHPSKKVPKAVIEKWNAYRLALADRESQHVRLAEECRDQLQRTIRESPPGKAQMIILLSVQEFRRREAILDAESKHGATSGLHFP